MPDAGPPIRFGRSVDEHAGRLGGGHGAGAGPAASLRVAGVEARAARAPPRNHHAFARCWRRSTRPARCPSSRSSRRPATASPRCSRSGRRRRPRSGWISCDDGDNDPAVLMACLAAAWRASGRSIRRLVASADPGRRRHRGPEPDGRHRPGRRPAVGRARPRRGDHQPGVPLRPDRVRAAAAAGLAGRDGLPARPAAADGPAAAAGRSARARRARARHGPRTRPAALLQRDGRGPDDAGLAHLVDSTEGWPLGLYFAGLAAQRRASRSTTRVSSAGATASSRLPAGRAVRADLARRRCPSSPDPRSSRGCADRCATRPSTAPGRAACSRTSSGATSWSSRSTAAASGTGTTTSSGSCSRRSCAAASPELVPRLHARAAAWLEAQRPRRTRRSSTPQAAGDVDRVARLVLDRMQPVWASGRVDTVLRWMTWLERSERIGRYPAHRGARRLIFALAGPAERRRALGRVARAGPADGVLARRQHDGQPARLPAGHPRPDGVEAMRRDARAGFAELARPARTGRRCSSPRACPTCSRATPTGRPDPGQAVHQPPRAGRAARWPRDPGRAVHRRRRSATTGRASTRSPTQALSIVEEGGFETTGPARWSTPGRAGGAAPGRHGGGPAPRRALPPGCGPLLAHSIPVAPVQALLELSRVYLGLGDSAGARRGPAAGGGHPRRSAPDLGVLPDEARDLRDTSTRSSATRSAPRRSRPRSCACCPCWHPPLARPDRRAAACGRTP